MDWSNPLTYTAIFAGLGVLYVLMKLLWKAAQWMKGRDSFESVVSESIERIEQYIGEIQKDVKEIFHRLPAMATAAGSPITLTDLGRSISDKLNADQWAMGKLGEVLKEISESIEIGTPYEIQNRCFEFAQLDANYTNEMMEFMKNDAYQRGIDLNEVKKVFGVELRDVVLRRLKMPAPD